jgi:hypothetical protein
MRKNDVFDDELEIPPTPPGFFRSGVMGKYYRGPKVRVVMLDADVAKEFPDGRAVNEALRTLREIRRLMTPDKRKKSA